MPPLEVQASRHLCVPSVYHVCAGRSAGQRPECPGVYPWAVQCVWCVPEQPPVLVVQVADQTGVAGRQVVFHSLSGSQGQFQDRTGPGSTMLRPASWLCLDLRWQQAVVCNCKQKFLCVVGLWRLCTLKSVQAGADSHVSILIPCSCSGVRGDAACCDTCVCCSGARTGKVLL